MYDAEEGEPDSVIRSGFLPRRVMDCGEESIIAKGLDGIHVGAAAVVITVYPATPLIFANPDNARRNHD